MMRASARLREAGFPHAVPLSPALAPRSVLCWLRQNLPHAVASVIPYQADLPADDFGVGFLVAFQNRGEAETFADVMARGLA